MKEWNAEDIRQLRNTFGLSQVGLAEKLGVTRVYIGMLERGEKKELSKTLKLLLDCVERDLTDERKGKRKGGTHGRAKRK